MLQLHANNFSFKLAVKATSHKLDTVHCSLLQEAPADNLEDVRGEHHQQPEAPCEGLLDRGEEVQAAAGPLRRRREPRLSTVALVTRPSPAWSGSLSTWRLT